MSGVQSAEGRRVGQVAGFLRYLRRPTRCSKPIEMACIKKMGRPLVGHKLAKARFHPPYDASPAFASLDDGLFVTPPTGMEVGYVPICVHQQQTSGKLPQFKRQGEQARKTFVIQLKGTPPKKIARVCLAGSGEICEFRNRCWTTGCCPGRPRN